MRRRARSRGAALLIALGMLVVVATAGVVLQQRTLDLAKATTRGRLQLAARWAAEGGIESARAALARDAAFTGSTLRVGATEVVVTVRADAADAALRHVRAVAVVAPSGPAAASERVQIDAVLRVGPGLPSRGGWSQ